MLSENNQKILQERTSWFAKFQNPQVGDFIKLPSESGDFFTRITHVHHDHVQTGGGGGSYYLGKGYMSYSGGLDPGIKTDELRLSGEVKDGKVWFFSDDMHRAHNGVDATVPCRVFTVSGSADLSGLWDYEKHLERIALAKLPKVKMINGNGNEYSRPLPKIHLNSRFNDTFMEKVTKSTGLTFVPCMGGLSAQVETYEQFASFMLCHNWEYVYNDNSTFFNTLMIK